MFHLPNSDLFFGYFDNPTGNKVARVVFKCCSFVTHSYEVKQFIKFDLPTWNNLVYENNYALNVTLVFEDKKGTEIFDLDVTDMNRRDINEVLRKAGLKKICYLFGGKPNIIPRDGEEDLF